LAAPASLVFVSAAQLHNIVAIRWPVAGRRCPQRHNAGPFMLFTTFVGYIMMELLEQSWLRSSSLPSFIFVIAGVHYVEKVRENRRIQAFLAGVSAAVVGIIAVVSLDLIPEALVDWPSVGIAVAAFLLIAFLKRDVALVALGAIVGGIIYSTVRALA
jgi:chromate transporter